MIIPEHIVVENVAGICSMRCNMCPIDDHFMKKIMDLDTFKSVVNKFSPYQHRIKFFTITGLGEPMLDKGIFKKIDYALSYKFNSVAVITNGLQFNTKNVEGLIDSGIHAICISLDGLTSSTQDLIRSNSNIDKITNGVINLVNLRNKNNSSTRLILRFTKQEINYDEWPAFYSFWEKKLDLNKGDEILCYDLHNHNELIDSKSLSFKTLQKYDRYSCKELQDRMTIRADGSVSFCCGDHSKFSINVGSILQSDPIEIFNNEKYKWHRKQLLIGNKEKIDLCKGCTIPDSIESKVA